MGVQSGNNQTNVSSAAPAQQPVDAGLHVRSEQKQAAAADNSGMWSFVNSGLPEIVSTKAGGADVRTIVATVAAIMAKEAPQAGFEVDTHVVDNTVDTGWRYSSVIVSLKQKTTNTVAFYPLVLESTETRALEADVREVGNIVYHVDRVPSDALDADMTAAIAKLMITTFPGCELLDVGGMVVARTVDAAAEDQVRPVLYNAVRACLTAIVEKNPDFVDMNLGLRSDDTYQSVSLQVTNQHHIDIVGQPIRQDVIVTLTARQKQNDQNNQPGGQKHRSIHDIGGTESVIGGIGGFFDVVITPPATNSAYAMANQNPLDRTRSFVKRLVLTHFNQPRLSTLSSTLMLLNQSMLFSDPSVSDSVFYQRMKQHRLDVGAKDKGVDPTDVGILNLISNVMNVPAGQAVQPFDLKSNTLTTDVFAGFMNQVFHPGFSLAIDVPRAGPQSWVLDVFTGAAAGRPEALSEIVRAANKLTNGAFGNHFFKGSAAGQNIVTTDMIFSEVNNTVHNGYYVKGDGVKRDIREVDYLYVLNRFGQMDKTALDWAMTFLVDRVNPYQRMARRKEIIEACVGGRVTITGFSERHTFSDHFVGSLFAACLDMKLKPNFQYNNPLAGATTGLVAPGFAQRGGMISGNLLQAGFTAAGNNAAAGGAFHNPSLGRW